jgi:hypothetical protein
METPPLVDFRHVWQITCISVVVVIVWLGRPFMYNIAQMKWRAGVTRDFEIATITSQESYPCVRTMFMYLKPTTYCSPSSFNSLDFLFMIKVIS